jgi:hypothetical protein
MRKAREEFEEGAALAKEQKERKKEEFITHIRFRFSSVFCVLR